MFTLKKILLVSLLISYINAFEVYVSNKRVAYKKNITFNDFVKKDIKTIKKHCKLATYKQIQSKKYYARHIILKNSILCQKDIAKLKIEKVIFNINNMFEIEKTGKVLRQTKDYIRFKDANGKIETIYTR